MPGEAPLPYDHLPEVATFTVESDEVADGQPIAEAHTADARVGRPGASVSPGLRWSGFPDGTKSFAVTVFDPDAPVRRLAATQGPPPSDHTNSDLSGGRAGGGQWPRR